MQRSIKNIFIYVQHLLGSGHLHRTALIAREMVNSGFAVTVVSGGVAESSIDFAATTLIQLPAIKTDSAFTDLFDQYGNRITNDFKRVRTKQLLRAFDEARPDLVLLETYPFGRRQMRFELLPLLQATKQNKTRKKCARPIVACSVRDVIQPKSNPKRTQETLDLLEQYFDTVFVHGDKNFIEFERAFPLTECFQDKLVYTGYVTTPPTDTMNRSMNATRKLKHILVSAGGGAVGRTLYQTAISASKCARGQAYNWHVLIGNSLPETDFRKIQVSQSDNLKIERNRNDFIDLLCQCSVSVSQGGYNTMMDIWVSHTPAVIIPFEGQAEQEQLIRASAFAENNLTTLLREQNLTTETLLTAIGERENATNPEPPQIALNGANWMADFIGNQEIED